MKLRQPPVWEGANSGSESWKIRGNSESKTTPLDLRKRRFLYRGFGRRIILED
jgi:hypothetical protein